MPRALIGFKLDTFWRLALLILALRVISGETSLLAYFVVMLYGVFGSRQAMEALLLTWFITMANPNIFGPVAGGSLGRFLVLFVVSISVILRSSPKVSHITAASFVLGFYITIHSYFFSPLQIISLLKGLSWTLAALSVTIAFSKMSRTQFRLFEEHAYSFMVLLLFLCVPAYLFHAGGQMVNIGYLRGVFGHSQAAGAFAAFLALWAFARILEKPERALLDFAVLSTGLVLTFLSSARTALFAALLAIVAVLILSAIRKRQPFRLLRRKVSMPVVVLGGMALIAYSLINIGSIADQFEGFIVKKGGSSNLAQAYENSRGGLIDAMLKNISNDPIVGVGFGIASDPQSMEVERIGAIPVSAVVEKGVAHIAVLEEIGAPGFIIYLWWLSIFVFRSYNSSLTSFGMASLIILVNFGDAYLFSVGGMGLLLLIFVGFASSPALGPRRGWHFSPAVGVVSGSGDLPHRL